MGKSRFNVYTWIQKLPSSPYALNGKNAQREMESVLKIIPVNDNVPPRNSSNSKLTFSINKMALTLFLGSSLLLTIAFVALLIFFFKHG